MKNTIKLTIIMLIVLVLTACKTNEVDNDKIQLVTSFYPMYIATSNIVEGVDEINLTNLTASTTGCLHDYQITTADMVKLSTADVLIINGGGMENFIDKAINLYKDLEIINASQGIKENHEDIFSSKDDEKSGEHREEDENSELGGHHHDHGENSHYWVSISLYIEQVKNIKDELIKINSENAEKYEQNASNYIKKLEELKLKMHKELDNLDNKNIVTFHEAFEFFAEEFDLNVIDVIEREPGTYPSSREIAEIIKRIKEEKVNAIFVEPQYSRTAADTISKETGINVYVLDPIVTGNLNKDAYINVMEQNLKTLKEALKN